MGSIDELEMFPLDFEEFLWTNNVGVDVVDYLRNALKNLSTINEAIHIGILSLFKDYLICGGLPDAIKEYVINKNISKTRQIHNQIYLFLESNFI